MPIQPLQVAVAIAVVAVVGGGAAGLYVYAAAPGDPFTEATHLHGLAVNADDAREVLLAAHEGLARGEPGEGWQLVGAWKSHVDSFATTPGSWGRQWASLHEAGKSRVVMSFDGGATWEQVGKESVHVHAFAPSTFDSERVWGVRDGRVARSDDSGARWLDVDSATPFPGALALSADPANPEGLYAAAPSGVHYSRDGGSSWISLREVSAIAVEVDPNDAGKLYAAFADGFFASRDAGLSWSRLGLDTGGKAVTHVAVNPGDPRMIYAATEDGALHRTLDSGATWEPAFGARDA